MAMKRARRLFRPSVASSISSRSRSRASSPWTAPSTLKTGAVEAREGSVIEALRARARASRAQARRAARARAPTSSPSRGGPLAPAGLGDDLGQSSRRDGHGIPPHPQCTRSRRDDGRHSPGASAPARRIGRQRHHGAGRVTSSPAADRRRRRVRRARARDRVRAFVRRARRARAQRHAEAERRSRGSSARGGARSPRVARAPARRRSQRRRSCGGRAGRAGAAAARRAERSRRASPAAVGASPGDALDGRADAAAPRPARTRTRRASAPASSPNAASRRHRARRHRSRRTAPTPSRPSDSPAVKSISSPPASESGASSPAARPRHAAGSRPMRAAKSAALSPPSAAPVRFARAAAREARAAPAPGPGRRRGRPRSPAWRRCAVRVRSRSSSSYLRVLLLDRDATLGAQRHAVATRRDRSRPCSSRSRRRAPDVAPLEAHARRRLLVVPVPFGSTKRSTIAVWSRTETGASVRALVGGVEVQVERQRRRGLAEVLAALAAPASRRLRRCLAARRSQRRRVELHRRRGEPTGVGLAVAFERRSVALAEALRRSPAAGLRARCAALRSRSRRSWR